MNTEESYYPADVQQPPQEPPHSIAAEGAVIGGLMLDSSVWPRISKSLTANDFYYKNHQLIFSAIKPLATAGQAIDVVTVANELDKKTATKNIGGMGSNLAYVAMLANDTISAANVESYAKIVKDHAVLRHLARAGQEISQAVLSKSADLDAIVAKTKSLLAEHDKQAKATFNAVLDSAENTAEVDLLCFLDDDHLC